MRTNRGRRLYVFLAVALAVFVCLMTLTGIMCDGFATSNPAAARHVEPRATDTPETAQLATVERLAADALKRYEAVHTEFTTFLTKHFAELVNTESDRPLQNFSDASQSENAEPATTAATPQMVPNPAWEKANQQLTDLRRRQSKLLANLTESHPLVRQIESAIADLIAQMKDLPAEVPPALSQSTAVNVTPLATPQPMPTAIEAHPANRWREVDGEFRDLLQRVEAAEKSYHAALEAERAERRSAEQAAAAPKTVPLVLTSYGGANPRLSIYLCGLVAIAAGILVSRRAQLPERTYQAAAEVRQSLGTAVLGGIPRDPHVLPREQPKQESEWVRRTVQVAEIMLAAAVLLLAIASLADRQFFLDLIVDPLTACSNKFWC